MLTVPIETLPTLPAFTLTTADADYWLQRYAYEECLLKWNMNQAGMVIHEVEEVDIAPFNASIGASIDELTAWWEDFLVNGSSELIVNLIDLAPVISTIAEGGATSVMGVLLGHCLNLLINQSQGGAQVGTDDEGMPDTLHITINNDDRQTTDDRWSVQST